MSLLWLGSGHAGASKIMLQGDGLERGFHRAAVARLSGG